MKGLHAGLKESSDHNNLESKDSWPLQKCSLGRMGALLQDGVAGSKHLFRV